MGNPLAGTFGHLLQQFMRITLTRKMYVPALTHATVHLLWYQTSLEMTTSVTLVVRTITSTSFTEMILSGMVLDVASTAPAVTGTLHHGSGKRSLPQLVMTLSYGCVLTRIETMKTSTLKYWKYTCSSFICLTG